jgi:hypothetical protein
MKRQRSPAHLDFVRSLPCIVCGDDTATEAAHIRYADPRAGKRQTGMGERPDDEWTLPLCGRCHRDQHKTSERLWWAAKGVDPVKAAMALSRIRDDREAAEQILAAHRI